MKCNNRVKNEAPGINSECLAMIRSEACSRTISMINLHCVTPYGLMSQQGQWRWACLCVTSSLCTNNIQFDFYNKVKNSWIVTVVFCILMCLFIKTERKRTISYIHLLPSYQGLDGTLQNHCCWLQSHIHWPQPDRKRFFNLFACC